MVSIVFLQTNNEIVVDTMEMNWNKTIEKILHNAFALHLKLLVFTFDTKIKIQNEKITKTVFQLRIILKFMFKFIRPFCCFKGLLHLSFVRQLDYFYNLLHPPCII